MEINLENKFENKEDTQRIKKIKNLVMLNLAEKSDEGKNLVSPLYDKLVNKIANACYGMPTELIMNSLLDVFCDVMVQQIDFDTANKRDAQEYVDEVLFKTIKAFLSIEKFYENNI